MPNPNRELSQFGSFLYVDNTTRNIGIATTATPYVGIGTTNPTYKLDIVGDTNVSGVISATGYYLNGTALVNAALDTWSVVSSDIYRLNGNVGIGVSVLTEKLQVSENISASRFISTVTTSAPFTVASNTLVTNLNADFLRGKAAPSGDLVGTSDGQTLTNKTINLANNSLTGAISSFNLALSDDDFVGIAATQTLTNKTLTTPIISGIRPSSGQLQTVPSGTGTLVSSNSVGVVTTGMIADGTITNSDVAVGAGISISKLAASTISGVSLGSTLANLTRGSYINYSSGTTYNGSAAITIGVAGTTLNTGDTLVARNASGDFSAGTISCANLNATFDVNSNSDENLKTNIKTIENAVDTVNSLRGVSFEWKENGKGSYGVIAQELERVLPELVTTRENKAVNYNGIIGVLIEAVKELSVEVEELKKSLNN